MSKTRVGENIVFNMDSMHDKLFCIMYDIEEGKISVPFTLLDVEITCADDVYELVEECDKWSSVIRSRALGSDEFARVMDIVNWREYQRSLASGKEW